MHAGAPALTFGAAGTAHLNDSFLGFIRVWFRMNLVYRTRQILILDSASQIERQTQGVQTGENYSLLKSRIAELQKSLSGSAASCGCC